MQKIGTLNEKPLHAALKEHFAPKGAKLEHKVGRYVADIYHDDRIIEIQTANFSSIGKKLRNLLPDYPITLVYPIAHEKWIIKQDGEKQTRRKSPKRQDFMALFFELVRIPDIISHPNLTLHAVLTREEEVRQYDGTRGWRKKGWVTSERRLLEIIDEKSIANENELLGLLPEKLPESFLTSDLAKVIGHPRWVAQKVAYCLRESGVIKTIGKQGNALEYALAG